MNNNEKTKFYRKSIKYESTDASYMRGWQETISLNLDGNEVFEATIDFISEKEVETIELLEKIIKHMKRDLNKKYVNKLKKSDQQLKDGEVEKIDIEDI